MPPHLPEQHSLWVVQRAPNGEHTLSQSGSLLASQSAAQHPSAKPHAGKAFSHTPPTHVSGVQGSPSSQLIGSLTQPLAGSQLSVVQGLSSLQLIVKFEHVPLLHTSQVQASKSSHSLCMLHSSGGWQLPSTHVSPPRQIIGSNRHPLAGLQLSFVHALPSSQSTVVPAQVPPEHASSIVQASPSLHALVLFGCWQLPFEQKSVVHGLLSLQSIGVPEQRPAEQRSLVVHESPSSQALVLCVYWQVPLEQ